MTTLIVLAMGAVVVAAFAALWAICFYRPAAFVAAVFVMLAYVAGKSALNMTGGNVEKEPVALAKGCDS